MPDAPVDRPYPFVGRGRELQLLGALTRGRAGGAVIVGGEPGIGRSALLDRVAAGAPGRVLRTRGVAAEAMVPFVALHDLLLPLHALGPQLPDVQWAALQAGLALRDTGPVSPLAVCAATLGILAAAAEQEPVLLVVDDLQWVDPSSKQVLLFVARRLTVDRVVLLATIGDDPAPDLPDDIPTLRLNGLSAADARTLVSAAGPDLSVQAREVVVTRAAGNPAALLALATDQEPRRQRGWDAALDTLPDAALRALYTVAMSGGGAVDEIETALAAVGGSLADLAPAERSGLVRADAGRVRLRHPLLHPAVGASTPLAARLQVHRALAEHGDDRHRLRHLAASVSGPDETVAARLADAAQAARDRGAHETAASVLGEAAALTPDPRTRAERLLAAAGDALVAGKAELAHGWCEEALALRSDPWFVADVELVRCRALTASGHPLRALDLVARSADAVLPHDRARAARLHAEAAGPALLANRVRELMALVRTGEALGDGEPTAAALVAGGVAHALCGLVPAARLRLDRAGRCRERETGSDPLGCHQQRALAAQARSWLEEHATALSALEAVLDDARRHGSAPTLSVALTVRAELAWWTGHWAAAHADGRAALHWAEEVQQAGPIALALVALARVDASRGDLAACRERTDRALSGAGPYGIELLSVHVPAVLGLAALGAGEPAEAARHLERALSAAEAGGLAAPTVVPFEGDLVEAHIRVGDLDRAHEALARLQARADATGLVYPTAAAARCRGMLTEDLDSASAAFADAARWHARCAVPFERARTQLCHAEMLRRHRRPAAARPLLHEALSGFDRLGARPWRARAETELTATGRPRPGPRAGDVALDALSPQELHVARAVADGLNNVEVAATLYLSRKTVEAHLTRVYRKLGLRSRADLARVLASPPAGGEPRGTRPVDVPVAGAAAGRGSSR